MFTFFQPVTFGLLQNQSVINPPPTLGRVGPPLSNGPVWGIADQCGGAEPCDDRHETENGKKKTSS